MYYSQSSFVILDQHPGDIVCPVYVLGILVEKSEQHVIHSLYEY